MYALYNVSPLYAGIISVYLIFTSSLVWIDRIQ